MDALKKIDVDDPDVDMDDAQRLFYEGELYTGEVAEYQGEALVSLDTYVEGRPYGLSRSWYQDGVLKSEGTLQGGRPVGEYREWHQNGMLKSRQVFGEAGYDLLEEQQWDEAGRQTKAWKRPVG